MTVLTLSDFACHSTIIDGCVKYQITKLNRNRDVVAVMSNREAAKDYTRELQRQLDDARWWAYKRRNST